METVVAHRAVLAAAVQGVFNHQTGKLRALQLSLDREVMQTLLGLVVVAGVVGIQARLTDKVVVEAEAAGAL